MDCTVTVNGDIGNPEIDAKKTVWFKLRRFVQIASLEKKESVVAIDEIAFATQPGEQLELALSTGERIFWRAVTVQIETMRLTSFAGGSRLLKGKADRGWKVRLLFLSSL